MGGVDCQMAGTLTMDEWWKGFVMSSEVHLGYNGLIFWGYAFAALLSIATILVMPAKGPPVTDLICWPFIAQLVIIIFFVFNPSANFIFCASDASPAYRAFQFYFAHAADVLGWNAALWLWLMPPRWSQKTIAEQPSEEQPTALQPIWKRNRVSKTVNFDTEPNEEQPIAQEPTEGQPSEAQADAEELAAAGQASKLRKRDRVRLVLTRASMCFLRGSDGE